MRWYHIFIVEIIAESVNLKIENYCQHDGEQLGFYKKAHITKRRAGCPIARNGEFQFIKRRSNTIFSMKKLDLDESSLNR